MRQNLTAIIFLLLTLLFLAACSQEQTIYETEETVRTREAATAEANATPTPEPILFDKDGSELAKFEPVEGNVIVFVGQDNDSVGGTEKHTNGYVDHIGVPGGITHYVYMTEGWTNGTGFTFDEGHVDGLYEETTWGAGPMCMRCYVESPILDNSIMHLSISMEGNSEDKVANGTYDYLIEELIQFLQDYPDTPFLIRIGYEFEGPWNNYDAENFKLAFQRIVDHLNEAGVTNYATVMASSSPTTPINVWEQYYPGDEYVDWVGYSYWAGDIVNAGSLEFAREHNKPVFIAESTPRSYYLDNESGEVAWDFWYDAFFSHIEENLDVIKAVSYINADWDAQPMWNGWGDTRIEANEFVAEKWQEKMAEPLYINAEDEPFAIIQFAP